MYDGDSPAMRSFFRKHCTDWVASPRPLDTPIRAGPDGIRCLSAGHVKHEWTTASALTSVFSYLTSAVAGATATPVSRALPPPASTGVGSASSSAATGMLFSGFLLTTVAVRMGAVILTTCCCGGHLLLLLLLLLFVLTTCHLRSC